MKNVLLIGQLTDVSGYGNAVRNYMHNLLSLHNQKKINLSLLNFSFENHSNILDEEMEIIKKFSITESIDVNRGHYSYDDIARIKQFTTSEYEVVFFLLNDWLSVSVNEDEIMTKSGLNLNYICRKSTVVHPCVVWETDSVPDIWSESYKTINVGSLICACEWNYDTFKHINDAVVIPYSNRFENEYDADYYNKIKGIVKDKFVFSSVFQWNKRKGIDKLITSFYLEFYDNPEVCLILKTYVNKTMTGTSEIHHIRNEVQNYISKIIHYGKAVEPKCKILILNDILNKRQINSIYKASDVYITCTRGEGFGLPISEAINFEKPVVVPSIGGHLDFIECNNNFFIDSTMEPALDYDNAYWSSINTNWVEVSINSTRKQMRSCLESQNLNERGKIAKEFMKSYLAPERCSQLFEEVLL